MHMNIRVILLSAISTACLTGLNAQQTWTYADCLDWALQHNITLQQSALSERLSDNALDESKAQWQPTLDFATTHSYANSPWTKGDKNGYDSSYGLNASWTAWDGGVRSATIKRNGIDANISRLNTSDRIRTLQTDLLQVYINILYAREAINIYQSAVELSKAQAERARQLMEAGRVSRVDYAQLQSQYEQDRYSLTNAEGTYDTRRMELKKLLELGIDIDIRLADAEWTAAQVLAAAPPMAESYSLALQTDAALRAAELKKESAAYDVDIARAGRAPSIRLNAGVGTGYSAPGDGFGTQLKQRVSESVGLTLSVPIFDARKTKTAVANAKIQQLNADLDAEQRRTDIAQIVESWYIDLNAAQARYTSGVEQEKAAQLSADLVNEQFSLGLVNTVELLTAHNNLLQARHSLLQAKYMAILGQKMIEFYRTSQVSIP